MLEYIRMQTERPTVLHITARYTSMESEFEADIFRHLEEGIIEIISDQAGKLKLRLPEAKILLKAVERIIGEDSQDT